MEILLKNILRNSIILTLKIPVVVSNTPIYFNQSKPLTYCIIDILYSEVSDGIFVRKSHPSDSIDSFFRLSKGCNYYYIEYKETKLEDIDVILKVPYLIVSDNDYRTVKFFRVHGRKDKIKNLIS